MVHGQKQYKKKLDTINPGMFGGHHFFIKNTDVLTQVGMPGLQTGICQKQLFDL